MSPADFLAALEDRLQRHHRPFSRAALIAFIAAAWPWIVEEPDPETWTAKFLETDTMAPA